jgi:cobalt-zinc-cadmium efflux system protein
MYHVLALDVRGRGESEWGPPEQYNIPTYVDDLGAVLDALGIQRISLIGNSMGGRISLLFAAKRPSQVERIVLNDIGPSLNPDLMASIIQYVADTPEDFADLDEVMKHFRTYPSRSGLAGHLGPELAERAKWSTVLNRAGRLAWKLDPVIRKPPGTTGAIRTIDMWDTFRSIKVPMLIVRGGDSDTLLPDMADGMCQEAFEASLVEVPGVGHLPSLTEPESRMALRRFFGS